MATNILKAYKLVTAQTLASSFNSNPVTLTTLDKVCFNIDCTSVTVNTGTFFVQHRVYKDENTFSSWATLTLTSVPTLAGANAVFYREVTACPGQLRIGFTSGGGGQNGSNDKNSGAGGKGIIILRTVDTKLIGITSGATVTQSGGYYIYTFADSGTIKWGA